MALLRLIVHLLVSLVASAAAQELYTDSYGDILRQSPPTLYQGGLIQFPKPGEGPIPNRYREEFTMYTLEGWRTTFTVEKNAINYGDVITFTEIIPLPTRLPIKTEIYRLTDNSTVGGAFHTSTQLEVYLDVTEGPIKHNIRIRWFSTPIETPAQWGFIDQYTHEDGIKWTYPEVEWIMLNLVSAGNASWVAQVGDTSISLAKGQQLLSTANVSADETIRLLANSTVDSDLLLEWFPYVPGNEAQVKSSGCLSYSNIVPTEDVYSWLLKDDTTPDDFPGTSLKISFYNVSASTSNFRLKVIVGSTDYLVAKHSIVYNAIYYIPVSPKDKVSLTLSSDDVFTLILCYEPSHVKEFSALGYSRSNGYPLPIKSSHPRKVEGLPLPADWSLTTTIEKFLIGKNRAWLDLVLTGGRSSDVLQSYTGNFFDESAKVYRYAKAQHIWSNYTKDFPYKAGRRGPYEVVSTFQSIGEAATSFMKYDGYSLKLEARLQKATDGIGTVYFTGDSGTIVSPSPYYASVEKIFYGITVSNTTAYNGIEFTFGNSYTEPYSDVIEIYRHEGSSLKSADGFTATGNMTGRVFVFKSTRMAVKFQSDDCKQNKGFVIDWRAVYIPDETVSTNISSPSAATSTTSTTDSVIDDGKPGKPEVVDNDMVVVVILSVAIFILLISLFIAIAAAVHARRKLSVIQRKQGFFKPEYNLQTGQGKINE